MLGAEIEKTGGYILVHGPRSSGNFSPQKQEEKNNSFVFLVLLFLFLQENPPYCASCSAILILVDSSGVTWSFRLKEILGKGLWPRSPLTALRLNCVAEQLKRTPTRTPACPRIH